MHSTMLAAGLTADAACIAKFAEFAKALLLPPRRDEGVSIDTVAAACAHDRRLAGNNFSGTFPDSFKSLTKLKTL